MLPPVTDLRRAVEPISCCRHETPSSLLNADCFLLPHLSHISNKAVTHMATEASLSCVHSWGGALSSIIHLQEAWFPSGDLHLARALGLSPDVHRVMLAFTSCSGGVAGLRVAKVCGRQNLRVNEP